mmetsp:Transcript_7266/g.15895  ORF Transcript_7266/g.15895 Transcript_7266/m.15895 type:complete len:487 (-) Transcript_7266:227-1687(-)
MGDQYVTMSIASLGESTLPRGERFMPALKDNLRVDDIDGARSGPKYKAFHNKPQFLQSDVPGATSKDLSWTRNVPDNCLRIDDIDGTRRAIKDRMMRTGRHVNPLQPNYPLPSYVAAEDPAPRFLRDAQDISDIEGCRPRVKNLPAPRDNLRVDDIDGTRPKIARHRRDNGSAMMGAVDSADLHRRFQDRTSRSTDPIAPHYRINGMEFCDEKEMKPRLPKKFIADGFQLQTKDIAGATPGWKSHDFDRREFRNTNFVQDVEGAQADTIKHSITTLRQSNPLAPVYQSLDPGETLQPLIPPLIPAFMIKVPTVPMSKGAPPHAPSSSGRSARIDEDLDPVSFAGPPQDRLALSSGRQSALQLNLPSQQVPDAGYYNTLSPYVSPYASGRAPSGRLGAAAASSLSSSYDLAGSGFGGSGWGDTGVGGGSGTPSARGTASARAKGVSYPSPGASARGVTGYTSSRTPSERRAALQLAAEITSVRSLQE